MSNRHPSTIHLLSLFEWAHLPEHLAAVSRPIGLLAHEMVSKLEDGPELSTGLRHLIDAKDCLVRQAVIDAKAAAEKAAAEKAAQ